MLCAILQRSFPNIKNNRKALIYNMTSKERAEKRAQANNMEPLFQLGKGGMSDALIKQVDDALTARELIKV